MKISSFDFVGSDFIVFICNSIISRIIELQKKSLCHWRTRNFWRIKRIWNSGIWASKTTWFSCKCLFIFFWCNSFIRNIAILFNGRCKKHWKLGGLINDFFFFRWKASDLDTLQVDREVGAVVIGFDRYTNYYKHCYAYLAIKENPVTKKMKVQRI